MNSGRGGCLWVGWLVRRHLRDRYQRPRHHHADGVDVDYLASQGLSCHAGVLALLLVTMARGVCLRRTSTSR